MGVGEAIRRYPKEIFWSGIFAFGLIMAGYDAQIIGSLYGLDSFNNHFGDLQDDGTYAVSAAWQTAISMGTPIGQILIIIYAYPLEAFGRKRTYAFTAAGCIALVFMQFFASNLKVLCAGEILAGILWGGCVLIAPTYSSEISHNSIRAVLEAANNIGFVIGQFIGNGVMDAMSDRTDRYAYKIPFAVQWIWPTLILAFIYWAPESPYWLVRKGRIDDARAVLVQLAPKDEPVEAIEQRLILIQETDALERELEQTTSYKDIFRGTNSIRTEIASMVYVIQIFSGIPLCMNYSTFFFEKAGLADSDAFSLSLGSTAIGFVFTVLSWFLLSYFGRRVLYTGGLAIATVLLFLIGFLDVSPSYDTNDSLRWAQASFVLIWSAVWQCTVGPVMYVVIGEIPSTKLRGKTIAFATAMQSVTALVFSIIMPYILDENEGNLRGKAGFIFGGLSLISVAWCYLRLPETKGRTFDEIDIMFHRGVDLRKFSGYNIMSEPEDIMSTLDGEIIMKAVTSRDKA
ncbi:unnamed protein product [Kuraishia capsulata CBS 1993]|uniref:Major facilitator superfamily (MFS) profile domain-containing protein n=1 Tax=Kuraishia capsulata CBS 1993 TaxID=1382522 RepID=W6MWB6_9ASCO|nr:uncharacterized protein KUCA_T00003137001 [Kuraishia capsulata CBS 1993]CDK27160.1 unnamed protein product [Kuraishia capsulata CBS 1993]